MYFDRMTEMVNSGSLHSFRDDADATRPAEQTAGTAAAAAGTPDMSASALMDPAPSMAATPPSSYESHGEAHMKASSSIPPDPSTRTSAEEDAYSLSHFFVVDSFNIHRLVIAGVTCASKFFSDVFYTNSRYAKV